jgi:hypothetical protein
MKMKGLVQSPEKKRKLTDGTPLSPEPQEQDEENHKLKPHQIKCSDDWRSVPEYPYDKLEDYTPNSEGRYACLHNHINAPKSCCKDGLTRTGKKSAIKKDVVRWKGKVEKLIDKGELDKRHMTWPDWTVRELRMKHQPALWAKQEAKRKADLKNRRRHEEMQTERLVRMNRENEKRTQGQQAVDQQSAIAQLTPSPDLPQRHVLRMIPTIIGPASPSVPHLPEQGPAHRPITTTRRSSDPTTASAHQPSATMAQASMNTQQLGPQTPLPIAETVDPPFDLSASATTYDLDDSLEIEAVVPLDGPLEQPISQIPWRFLSPEELNSELDRILGLDRAAEPTVHGTTALRSETWYLTTLPPAFATGNQSVDDEMRRMLEPAYQTEPRPDTTGSEDEQLLRQTIEQSRPNWQRYCDFVNREQPLAEEAMPVEQQPINEFDFGRPFSQQELAMFDDFDDEPSLFVHYDAGTAAAQAASPLQDPERNED